MPEIPSRPPEAPKSLREQISDAKKLNPEAVRERYKNFENEMRETQAFALGVRMQGWAELASEAAKKNPESIFANRVDQFLAQVENQLATINAHGKPQAAVIHPDLRPERAVGEAFFGAEYGSAGLLIEGAEELGLKTLVDQFGKEEIRGIFSTGHDLFNASNAAEQEEDKDAWNSLWTLEREFSEIDKE